VTVKTPPPSKIEDIEAESKGSSTYPYIDIHRWHDLYKIVKQTPTYKYMWVYTGSVVILKEGKYTFCTASDDGSKVWFDGKLTIDNDGFHSEKEVCRQLELKAGTIQVKVAGFTIDHDCVQTFTYAGPDTDNRRVFVNSVGKAKSGK